MPELILEIGGRVFEVACDPGQEYSLEQAGRILDAEATRIGDAGRATEDRVRQAEERARIAEAKSAMLAANALKLETEASHKASPSEVAELREENEAAAMLIGQVIEEINSLTASVARA
jgi:cell division protein ZapA